MTAWVQPGTAPTPRELEVARAVLASDSMAAAARLAGVSERSVREHLAKLRIRLRAKHNAELFYRLRDHLS